MAPRRCLLCGSAEEFLPKSGTDDELHGDWCAVSSEEGHGMNCTEKNRALGFGAP